jgi:capsular exopolysaccharide synthesis family protein
MSRVDEALRRAAAAPKLLGVATPTTDQIPDRVDGSVLQLYPAEKRSPPAPAGAQPGAGRTGHVTERWVAPRYGSAYRGRLVVDAGVSPIAVEQYRRLAATMHHIQVEQGLKHLMVSSASPREGKTLTIVNLALTLSASYGRRVLLIDADLRRPSVHEVFGIPNKHGLSQAIWSESTELRTSRVAENLWVLPAGAPDGNAVAALASHQVERLLADATASFDWILLDAPPFGVVADAALLVRLVRAAIVVIAAGSTQHASIEKAVAQLGREYIVGAVLNRTEENPTPWSEYYGGDDDVNESFSIGLPTELGEAPARGKKVDLLRS